VIFLKNNLAGKGGNMKKTAVAVILIMLCSFAQGPEKSAEKPDSAAQKTAATPQAAQTAVQAPEATAPVQVPADPSKFPIDKIPVADSIKIPVLDFKNADVRDVLRGLGMQYKVNIFTEPDVTGPITLYLTNVSVRSAIDFVVKRSGCVYTVEGGIVKVAKYKAPPPPEPPKPKVTFNMTGGLLNIDLKKVPIQNVARMFGDSAAMNVVVEGGGEGEISARLVGLKPDKAVRALFEPNGYDISTRDGIYYVSKQSAQSGGSGGSSGGGPRRLSFSVKNGLVTLDVDNASLDQTVRSIANESGMNMVVYDRLTGEISAKLSGVPIDDALRFLLQNTKFTMWKEKEIYFIGSREMNQQKTTVIIPMRHIMADEATISKILPPNVSTNAVVKYDKEHNALVVIGSFDVVAQAQEFVEKIDRPVPQVLIEALVIDFNLNKIRDYGLTLFTQGPGDSSGNWLSEKFLPDIDLKPGRKNTKRILQNMLKEIGIDRIIDLPENFRSNIHALETADIVKVHSTPQIATINGNQASITIGETRYYKLRKETTASTVTQAAVIGTDERFEVIKFNTQLDVTPWVMDDGYVMVKIRPEFNIPRTGGDGTTPPNVDTRVIESMVRLRNGQTIVLGGQRQTENLVSRRGVPFLSSIPILGWLFSSRTVSKTETQMMIFLTPHVYYGDDNQVEPSDFFGSDVEKLTGKKNAEKRRKAREKKLKKESGAVNSNTETSVKPDSSATDGRKRFLGVPLLRLKKKAQAAPADTVSQKRPAVLQ
jgi:type II secretory pathway component GspD/PulD (secretin)